MRDNLFFVVAVLLVTIAVIAVVWMAPSNSERVQSFNAECSAAGFTAEQCAFLLKLSTRGRSAETSAR
jgi:hypothetical protein